MGGWTIDTLMHHIIVLLEQQAQHRESMRLADKAFQDERDLRYAQVSEARAKAVRIKEEADQSALQLAREIQTYKDEQANELRNQLRTEREGYATKTDLGALTIRLDLKLDPMLSYVSSQQGRSVGLGQGWIWLCGLIGLLGTIGSIITFIMVLFK